MPRLTNLTDACDGCPGRCCTRRFWSRVILTKTESRDPLLKGLLELTEDGEPALGMGKTACHFLDRRTGRCKIYEQRPMACRGYVCHTAGGHSSKVIHDFPALKNHLKRKGLLPAIPHSEDSYFCLDDEGATSVWHLRELRGTKSKGVVYYSAKSDTHEIIGRFDRRGKFHRNKT